MNKDGGTKQQKRSKTKEITNSKLEINNTKWENKKDEIRDKVKKQSKVMARIKENNIERRKWIKCCTLHCNNCKGVEKQCCGSKTIK